MGVFWGCFIIYYFRMKKLVCFLGVIGLVVGLGGCAGSEDPKVTACKRECESELKGEDLELCKRICEDPEGVFEDFFEAVDEVDSELEEAGVDVGVDADAEMKKALESLGGME